MRHTLIILTLINTLSLTYSIYQVAITQPYPFPALLGFLQLLNIALFFVILVIALIHLLRLIVKKEVKLLDAVQLLHIVIVNSALYIIFFVAAFSQAMRQF